MEQVIIRLRIDGDDDVTKPVQMGVLLARIEVRSRGHGRTDHPIRWQGRAGHHHTGTEPGVGVSQESIVLLDWQRPLLALVQPQPPHPFCQLIRDPGLFGCCRCGVNTQIHGRHLPACLGHVQATLNAASKLADS